jgi:hypothetical protein
MANPAVVETEQENSLYPDFCFLIAPPLDLTVSAAQWT